MERKQAFSMPVCIIAANVYKKRNIFVLLPRGRVPVPAAACHYRDDKPKPNPTLISN